MDTVLRIEGLCKRFPGFALSDVSLSLKRGYVMGFIGQNGAGKTTTIKCIMNLIRRDSGRIEIFGLNPARDGLSIRDRIGFVFDELCFYGVVTAAEMGSIVAPFYSRWSNEFFSRRVRDFDIDTGRKIDRLSRGQKMKLSLAIALSHEAELIIMDEPTSGLDPVFRVELLDILYRVIQDENRSIFFSSHLISDLERIADFVTFIHDGRIVLCDSKDAILERFRLVKGPLEGLTAETRALCVGTRETRAGFEALTESAGELSGLVGGRAVVERATLEDIMVHMARRTVHA
jgi:ABC-2 type transport system ATP-binding protein